MVSGANAAELVGGSRAVFPGCWEGAPLVARRAKGKHRDGPARLLVLTFGPVTDRFRPFVSGGHAVMGLGLRRAGGFVVGFVLFLVGFALLQPNEGMVQTGVTIALASVLTALGIGVIAAAALPQTLEVSGEEFKPLGFSVKASGGAAVFLLTLGFIYYMKDVEGSAAPDPRPSASASAVAEGGSVTPTPTPVASAGEQLASGEEVAPAPVSALENNSTMLQAREDFSAPQSSNFYVAWTWCSACCPEGPDYCQQVGLGQDQSPDAAAYYAAEMCIRNGGHPDTCQANVQYLSADDLAELGY